MERFEEKYEPGKGMRLLMNSLSGGERNRLFLRRDENYDDVSLVSGADSRTDGRGFVLLDFDRDGWLDMACVSPNRPKFRLFRNSIANSSARSNHWLALRLIGGQQDATPTKEWSAADGFGAKILVTTAGNTRVFEHQCGEGLANQNSDQIHIGLGVHDAIDKLKIIWPSGRATELENVRANQVLEIAERRESVKP